MAGLEIYTRSATLHVYVHAVVVVFGVKPQFNIKLNENKNNIQFLEKRIKSDTNQCGVSKSNDQRRLWRPIINTSPRFCHTLQKFC